MVSPIVKNLAAVRSRPSIVCHLALPICRAVSVASLLPGLLRAISSFVGGVFSFCLNSLGGGLTFFTGSFELVAGRFFGLLRGVGSRLLELLARLLFFDLDRQWRPVDDLGGSLTGGADDGARPLAAGSSLTQFGCSRCGGLLHGL